MFSLWKKCCPAREMLSVNLYCLDPLQRPLRTCNVNVYTYAYVYILYTYAVRTATTASQPLGRRRRYYNKWLPGLSQESRCGDRLFLYWCAAAWATPHWSSRGDRWERWRACALIEQSPGCTGSADGGHSPPQPAIRYPVVTRAFVSRSVPVFRRRPP